MAKKAKGPDTIRQRAAQLADQASFAEREIKHEKGLVKLAQQYRGFQNLADAEEFLRKIQALGLTYQQFYEMEQAARHYFRAYEASKQNLKEMEAYMSKFQSYLFYKTGSTATNFDFETADGRKIVLMDLFGDQNARWQSVLVERFGFREPKK